MFCFFSKEWLKFRMSNFPCHVEYFTVKYPAIELVIVLVSVSVVIATKYRMFEIGIWLIRQVTATDKGWNDRCRNERCRHCILSREYQHLVKVSTISLELSCLRWWYLPYVVLIWNSNKAVVEHCCAVHNVSYACMACDMHWTCHICSSASHTTAYYTGDYCI